MTETFAVMRSESFSDSLSNAQAETIPLRSVFFDWIPRQEVGETASRHFFIG
jgi:hypothetical protein